MWLFNSSVGKKIVMSVTGLCLILFVTFHVLMNAVAIPYPDAYDAICRFLGANWYALIATVVLAAGFVIHIFYAFWLTIQNKKARGTDAYAVSKKPKQVEWASKNMLVLGIIIVVFLAVHFIQFWYKMQFQEIIGAHYETADGLKVDPANGQFFLYYAFKDWWTLAIYALGFVALWFHMTHGFWSGLQSLGANNRTWLPRLRTVSFWWATIVCGLFLVEGVVFTLRANCPAYEENLINNAKIELIEANEGTAVTTVDAQGCNQGSNNGCAQNCDQQ